MAADPPDPLDSSLQDAPRVRPKHSWGWLFYLLAALILGGAIVWATIGEMNRNSARDASVDLGPYGLVSIQLTTNPNPPKPVGTVQLNFMPMDGCRRTVPLDRVSYDYGRAGSDRPIGSGEAQVMTDGSGMFMAGARFTGTGDWWIRVRLIKGGAQGEVRFTINVKPAQ